MAKGATSKKKREEENRQNTQQRQTSQQREETRQRQQRTQGNSNSSQRQSQSRNDRADSRQTTRREVAPAAIPVLEERSTPRRSASGRNVAEMFPEYEPQQAATIPVVQPIPTTNKGQGFQADLDQRMRDYYNNGTPIARRTSERAQETAEQPETTSMPVGADMAEKGRKMAQRASQTQATTAPIYNENGLTEAAQAEVDDLNRRIEKLSKAPLQNERQIAALKSQVEEIYNSHHASSEDYLVSRDRYDTLMQDKELANDIKNLTQIIYNPRQAGGKASADAVAERLTNGQMDSEGYYGYLEDKYGLSRAELEDMALTHHSDDKAGYAQTYGEKAAKFGEEHPRLGSTLSFAGSVGNAVEGGYNTLVGALTDDNRRFSRGFNTTKTGLREGVKENLNNDILKGVYDVGMGVGDMLLGGAMGSAPLLLAGNTANEALLGADAKGQSARKAATYGALSGVADYYFNKVGLDKAKELALESVKASGVKKMLANMGIAGLGEAGENVLQDITQSFLDEFINGNRSDLRSAFADRVASGMSEDQAFKQTALDYLGQLGMSGLTGFAMGATMQGGRTLKNEFDAGLGNRLLNRNSDRVNAKLDEWRKNKIPQMDQPEAQEMSLDELGEQLNPMNTLDINDIDFEAMDAERQRAVQNIENLREQIPEVPEDKNDTNNLIPATTKENYVPHSRQGENPAFDMPEYRADYSNGITKNMKSLEMPDDVRGYVNSKVKTLDDIFDRIDNAQTKEELDGLYKELNDTVKDLDDTLKDSAQARLIPKRTFDDNTKSFVNAIKGMTINVPDNVRAELPNQTLKQLEARLHFYGDGQNINVHLRKNSGIGIDSVFEDIDAATGHALSSFMELNGLNPDVTENQLKGILEYADYLKETQNSTKVMDYTGGIFDDYVLEAKRRINARSQALFDARKATKNVSASTAEAVPAMPDDIANFEAQRQQIFQEIDEATARGEDPSMYYGMLNDLEEDMRSMHPELFDAKTSSYVGLPNESANVPETPATDGGNPPVPPVPPDDSEVGGTGKMGRRRTMTNTLVNAGVVNAEDLETDPTLRGITEYETHSNDLVQGKAIQDIDENEEAYKQAYANGTQTASSDLDVDRMMELLTNRELTPDQFNSIIANLATENTEHARVLQALAKYNNTPEKALFNATKVDLETTKAWESRNSAAKTANNRVSQTLMNAIKSLNGKTEPGETIPPSIEQIRQQVENTLYSFDLNKGYESLKEGNYRVLGDLFSSDDMDYLANLIEHGATVTSLRDALNTKLATGRFGVTPETQAKVKELFEYARQFDVDSQDFVEAEAEAFRLLAEEVAPKATGIEKFDTWRYMAMLGNPKTMLRNFVGNKLFSAVTGISNNLAALGEETADRMMKKKGGIQRTKAFLNPVKDSGLINAAKADARAKEYRHASGTKYEKIDQESLKSHRSVWNNKLLQLTEKAIDAGISDTRAVINKYATSLAGYMKANGLTEESIKQSYRFDELERKSRREPLSDDEREEMNSLRPIADAMEKGRKYALEKADYATFHEDNALADWLSRTSQSAPGPLRHVIEGIVPFKKTPANVLRSGLEYSPLNIINSVRNTGKLIIENTGKNKGNLDDEYVKLDRHGNIVKGRDGKPKMVQKSTAADVLDSWSKTLTGSGLVALGYYLFNKGILHSSDKDTKYQDQLEGRQNYAIEINGHSYTIDWSAPAVMPLLLGAEISKVRQSQGQSDKEWYKNLDQYLNAINTIADPIFETSMLSGIKDAFETAANSARNNDYVGAGTALLYNSLTGYLSQGIPTISGQVARTIDNTRRSTYAENEGVLGTLEKQWRKTMNKIPFLSMLNEPYYDTYARTQNNGPFQYEDGETGRNMLKATGNLAYQMGSVGYLDDINTTPADQIAWDVYDRLKPTQKGDTEANQYFHDANLFANRKSSKSINGERLSTEDFAKYSQASGQAQYDIRTALANDEWFNNLSNNEKGDILKSLNNLSDKIGEAAVNPDYESTDGAYNAYASGGIQGYLNYLQSKSITDAAGLKSNSKMKDAINEAVANGDLDRANELSEISQALSPYGLKSEAQMVYVNRGAEALKDYIPGLTADQYGQFFQSISGGDDNVSQTDLLAALNEMNVTDPDKAMALWQGFLTTYTEGDTKVPQLIDGEWKAVSPDKATSTTSQEVAVPDTTSGDVLEDAINNRRDQGANAITTLEPQYQPGNNANPVEYITSAGLNLYSPEASWNKAYAANSNLTPQEFVNTWSAVDADNNGRLKKSEFVKYLNSMGYTPEEAELFLAMYYPSSNNALSYRDNKWHE